MLLALQTFTHQANQTGTSFVFTKTATGVIQSAKTGKLEALGFFNSPFPFKPIASSIRAARLVFSHTHVLNPSLYCEVTNFRIRLVRNKVYLELHVTCSHCTIAFDTDSELKVPLFLYFEKVS